MKTINIKADKRKVFGKKVKNLRKDGLVPANIFGNKIKSLAIQVDQKEFTRVFSEAGETGIVEIQIEKEKRPTLISNVQVDPVTDSFLHIDFKQVDLTKKVSANVPVELIGEAPAEKQGLGTLIQHVDEIEVESLPTDLPEKVEVDVSILDTAGGTIYVKDLKIDTKVDVQEDPEKIVAAIEEIKEEVIEEKPAQTDEAEEAESGEVKSQAKEDDTSMPEKKVK